MRTQAVLFDFDGVVLDSEPLHYEAFQRTLFPFGISHEWSTYLDQVVGFDDRDALRFLWRPKYGSIDEALMRELIEKKADHFEDLVSNRELEPYPGVIDLILFWRRRVPLAICSGALLRDIRPVLERFQLTDCFEEIVTADQVEKSKPDPVSYRMCFQRLQAKHPHLQASCCVAIEDTPAGIDSALGAGLYVIGVAHTHDRKDLQKANREVSSLVELMDGQDLVQEVQDFA